MKHLCQLYQPHTSHAYLFQLGLHLLLLQFPVLVWQEVSGNSWVLAQFAVFWLLGSRRIVSGSSSSSGSAAGAGIVLLVAG